MTEPVRAFALSQSKAALATHIYSQNSICSPPSVQIMGMAGGMLVSGTEELTQLRDAINFALNGEAPHD